MLKKLFSLLALTIFIGANAVEPPFTAINPLPTDAAKKINSILSKMGAIKSTSPTGCYTEISPDAQNVNTYNANHECTNSQPISARIKNILSELDEKNEQKKTEAEFFCYRLGTRLEIQNRLSQSSKFIKFMEKFVEPFSLVVFANLIDFGFKTYLDTKISIRSKIIKRACKFNAFFIPRTIVFSYIRPHFKSACLAILSKFSEKQDEEELDRKTFYNVGLYTDTDYSCFLEKMKSPLCKKAFENGRKERKNQPNNN